MTNIRIPVQHLRTSDANKKPGTGQLEVGEIAINLEDGRLYTKNDSDIVIQVASGTLRFLEDCANIEAQENQFLQVVSGKWEPRTISPTINVNLTGPITGNQESTLVNLTGNTISIPTTITPDSVILSYHTEGCYVGNIVSNSGVYVDYVPSENATPRIWIGQNVDTTSNVLFNNVTATVNVNTFDANVTNNVHVGDRVTASTFVGIGAGFQNEVWFLSDTTWTIPSTVETFYVMCMAGAGSGGSAMSGLLAGQRYGHGGNSGAVCWKTYKRIPGIDTITITVGQGGVVTAPEQKANGGNTSVIYNSETMIAFGGTSGNHYNQAKDETPATFSGTDTGLPGTIGDDGGTGNNCGSANGGPLGYGHRVSMRVGGSARGGLNGIGYNAPGAGGTSGINNSSRRGGDGTGGFVLIRY